MSDPLANALEVYRGVDAAVFGATGFIGRWVCRALVAAGARPTLIVRNPIVGEELRLELGSGKVVECDIEDPSRVAHVMDELKPTITFNLAGYGVDRSERDEVKMFAVNARFLQTLCAGVAACPTDAWRGQRLVQAGTQLEYGPVTGLVYEQMAAHPATAYGRSKLEATRTIGDCARAHGVRAVSARLFTVYGPGEHARRLLPSLMETAITGRALDLTTAEQRLDFTYVEDVAEGLLRLGCCNARPGTVVNVARGELVAVRDFVDQAARILEIPRALLRFGALPSPPEEMRYSGVSNFRLRALADWTPPRDVAAGIRRTLEWSRTSNAHV